MSILQFIIYFSSQEAFYLMLFINSILFGLISNSHYIYIIRKEGFIKKILFSIIHLFFTVFSFMFINWLIKYVFCLFIVEKCQMTCALLNLTPAFVLIPAIFNIGIFVHYTIAFNGISNFFKNF